MTEKKYIKIPKNFFKDLKFDIKVPTFVCKFCGEGVLLTPTNLLKFSHQVGCEVREYKE